MQPQPDNWYQNKRIGGLWRFAIAITVLNLLGHTVLGFEQAWADSVRRARRRLRHGTVAGNRRRASHGRRPRYLGSPRVFVEFLLTAHITGLAVGMLLYSNERFWVIAFAAATAIASKYLFHGGDTNDRQAALGVAEAALLQSVELRHHRDAACCSPGLELRRRISSPKMSAACSMSSCRWSSSAPAAC